MSNNPFRQDIFAQNNHQTNGIGTLPNAISDFTSRSETREGDEKNRIEVTGKNQEATVDISPISQQSQSNSHHAHIPSFSHIRKESLPITRPTYVRALSSHISEAPLQQSQFTPSEARAEILRRLSKVNRSNIKPLKRRGSNESLSSLLSYSIRRPSLSISSPTKPEGGYSLDALAVVLEDVCTEGNLTLVEAVMAMGVDPNFRSVNRLKNRRHDALNKATAAGHVDIIEYLLRNGAVYSSSESQKRDGLAAVDRKLLEVTYSGFGKVATYLITTHGANPFAQAWPREYEDALRTVYRRVVGVKVWQRSVLDAISRMGNEKEDKQLLNLIMSKQEFEPSAISTRIYTDTPYLGDGTRLLQTTYHYSTLAAFIKAGWADAVGSLLKISSDPAAYENEETATNEEGQIPSSSIERSIWPVNALTKDTWLYHRDSALRILHLLLDHGFNFSTAQQTADDSAPRTPLSRAILANAPEAVDLILSTFPELLKEEISFRLLLQDSVEQEYRAQPLAASIAQGSLECARVLIKHGASPHDPAFSYSNVTMFCAGHGGVTAIAILGDLIALAPELLYAALETAINKLKSDAVDLLLDAPGAITLPIWNMVLACKDSRRGDEDVKRRYLQVMDVIHAWDEEGKLKKPGEREVGFAFKWGNSMGTDRLVEMGVLGKEMLDIW